MSSSMEIQVGQSNKKALVSMVGYLPVFILPFLILSSFCESTDQLRQPNPLSPGSMLISESGAFALGFFSPTNSSKSLFIGIWYHNMAECTVVWVANRDSPITTPSSSVKLAITNSSELELSDSKGHILWTTANNVTIGGAGAVAVLLDSGNFIVRLPNGTVIWQSFEHPTDTILPTMRFVLSNKEQVPGRLVAWTGPDDPSTGNFSLSVDPSSNLQIFIWQGTSPYSRVNVFEGVSVVGMTYLSNPSSVMYQTITITEDESYFMFTVSNGSLYTRISIGYTGKLRLMSWNNTTLSWTVIGEEPSGCDLYASCGPFGYCDYMEAISACRCLDGFQPIDSLNVSRGCQRKEDLECRRENHFVTLPEMKVPDKFLHIENRSFDQCAAECSENCSCSAYAYANTSIVGTVGDTSLCWVWTGDLIDMGKVPSFGENLYLWLADSPVQKNRNLVKIIPPIIACLLLLACIALIWRCKYRGKRKKKEAEKRMMREYMRSTDEVGDKNIEFPFIRFADIVAATDNFSDSNMLGKGGFGKVYKGLLDGIKEVAVKRLSKGSGQGIEEFRNEVVLIAKLQHKNLVKLLGCCIHEDEKLLVYEYLHNKSLDYFLFDSARKPMLQWPARYKIIKGIARGILYLHQDSRLTVIHRDLKASNILLDKEMSPEISDFGMARILCGDQHQANTNRVAGTYGYMSPEYAMEGEFSVKSDTYSFGVLMLEIGMLEGGKEVAVKRLSKGSVQGVQEFRNEVVLIAKLQHRNLVRLLGFCIHQDEKLLIYEYLSNKSLDAFLFDATRKSLLDWPTRFKIIKGVVRGILYLHQDSRLTIIHRDLKASNILLDTDMCPKISDFGMARIFVGSEHQANTSRVVGTYGYMSPEYAMEGSFSVKSDTYSFGVLLLEIVSGLKISSPQLIMNFPNLIAYAWSLWRDGNAREFVDSSISESCSLQEVMRCLHLGLLCIQDHPNARPLMSSIAFMLENETTQLPTPKEPLYFTIRNYETDRSREYMQRSLNNMSITILEAR